jgi:hypothetical protein
MGKRVSSSVGKACEDTDLEEETVLKCIFVKYTGKMLYGFGSLMAVVRDQVTNPIYRRSGDNFHKVSQYQTASVV